MCYRISDTPPHTHLTDNGPAIIDCLFNFVSDKESGLFECSTLTIAEVCGTAALRLTCVAIRFAIRFLTIKSDQNFAFSLPSDSDLILRFLEESLKVLQQPRSECDAWHTVVVCAYNPPPLQTGRGGGHGKYFPGNSLCVFGFSC